MASRQEDEKNEKTIRNLLKLPANKRCINCNSLGPQYVCTNFWTFVCTTCSGIHREFTHRVKSVSMAKFTSEEVAALQSGGNERAKSIYFKDWDTQRHSFPDRSNIDRLRDFIRHVYVDRRFSGGKASEKPPRGEDSHENRKSDTSYGGSRSPPYEDSYERRHNDRPSQGGRSPPYEDTYEHRRHDRPSPGGRIDESYSKYDDRSPGHDKESRYSSDQGKSPSRPEIVNDWRREDRFGNARRPEDRRTSDVDSFSEGRSPDHQKDISMSSPPVVPPVRDILGDNVIPLKIDPPKPNSSRASDAPVHVVRTTATSSHGSADGSQVEPKRETLGSLIDFDAEPEPPVPAAPLLQKEQTNSVLATPKPTSSASNDNWASFDFAAEAKVPQVQSTPISTLDSLLMLSAPALAPVQSGQSQNFSATVFASGGDTTFFSGGVSKPDMPVGSLQMPPSNAGVSAGAPFSAGNGPTSAPVNGNINFNNMNAQGSWPGMQHQQQPYTFPHGASPHLSFQQPSSLPAAQHSHPIPRNANEVANGLEPQPPKAETKSRGRSELPEDLFTATYPPFLSAPQGWHTGHQAGMGYAMQYNVAAPPHSHQQPSKSSNPFDFGNESATAPVQWFPSMTTLHSALPTMGPPSAGLMHNSGAGAPSQAYMQHHVSSYPSQDPSYASGMPSGSYFSQQVPQNAQATRPQGVGGIGDSSLFGSGNSNLLMAGGYSAPTAPNPFPSAGGNPFG